jgi:hypothetical protein
VPLSTEVGLPKLLVESRFFKDLDKIRRACYCREKASTQERELFREFLEGGIVSRSEADWSSSLFIKACSWLTIEVKGWRILRQIILLLDQHERLTQPWGARMLKWVIEKIPQVQVPVGNVAAAA